MWTIWCRLSGLLILVIKCKQILFYAFPTMVDSYFLLLLLGASIWEHDENELSWGCVEYLKPWFSLSNRVFISSSFRLLPFHCELWKLYSHVLHFLLFTIPRRNYFHCLSVKEEKNLICFSRVWQCYWKSSVCYWVSIMFPEYWWRFGIQLGFPHCIALF